MAAIRPIVKPVAQVARVAQVAKPVAAKPVTKAIPKDGFEIVNMSAIIPTLVSKSGGGGGKPLTAFATKVFSLDNGQGFKISEERYGDKGKGIASVYAGASRRQMKLRVRRDQNNQLWLYRVTTEQEAEALQRKAERDAEKAEAEAAEATE